MAQQKFLNGTGGITLSARLAADGMSAALPTGKGVAYPVLTGGDFYLVTLAPATASDSSYEVIKSTGAVGDNLVIAQRAVEGAAKEWQPGDRCECRTSAAMLDQFARAASNISASQGHSVIILGDSITCNNNYNNGAAGSANVTVQYQYNDTAFWHWANVKMKNPFFFLRNAGVSGDKVADVLARLDRDVRAYKPDNVFLLIGINDISASPNPDVAAICAGMSLIQDRLVADGTRVRQGTILPNGTIENGTAAQKEALYYVNNFILMCGRRKKGVSAIDLFSALYDPATICNAVAGTFVGVDKTHPFVTGNLNLADYIIANLEDVPKPIPVRASRGDVATATHPYGNILGAYGIMTYGTGGSTYGLISSSSAGGTPATVNGNAPDGWWLQMISSTNRNDFSGCTVTSSLEARTEKDKLGKFWWKDIISYTAAQPEVVTFCHRTFAGVPLPVSVSAGDLVDIALEIDYSAVTNAGPMEIFIEARNSSNAILDVAAFKYAESAVKPWPAFSGVVPITGFPIPAGCTQLVPRIIPRNLAGTAGGFTLRLGDFEIRKRVTL